MGSPVASVLRSFHINQARNFIKSVSFRVHPRFSRASVRLALFFLLARVLCAAEPQGAATAEGSTSSEPPPPAAVAVSESQSAYAASIARLEPMDTTGLNPDLVTVLSGYYRNSFTSSEHWEQIESIRFDGTLELPNGSLRFTAFKKKPDYCKIVIFAPNGGRIVMAYDGQDAWQFNTLQPDAQPTDLDPLEALNFIRDATTGGHLLYPLIPDKQIELVGAASLNGRRHYELLVTLPDGEPIRSLLDMTTYAEAQQTTVNHVNGQTEVTTHSDFREIDGVRFPFVSTLTVEGEQMHQSRIDRVQVNLGVMPWMFSRSSGAALPGGSSPAGSKASHSPSRGSPSLPSSPAVDTLRLGASSLDSWSTESVFQIDPTTFSEQEAADILQQIGNE